jgi:methylisocitrate lyase
MLYAQKSPADKRADFRAALASGELLRFPGAFNPLSARLIEQKGFEGVYISGAVLAADLGLPDIGLTTLTEVAGRARQIARMTELPTIVDADTGFGEPMNVARTVQELEDVGLAGLHIEDQVNPKRCGHFAGKSVVSIETMIERVVSAVEARHDPDMLIIARTDARQAEGITAAIRRAQAYVAAGADAIFVEAPQTLDELRAIPKEFDVPVVANMVEGGATPIVPSDELAAMGYRIVLYANALSRLASAAVVRGLATLREYGTTTPIADEMLSWESRQRVVGLPAWQAYEEDVIMRAQAILEPLGRKP